MTFYILLGLSAFLLSLLGTRLTILALRMRASRKAQALLHKNKPLPPGRGGMAVSMVLIIGLMVADIDYGVVIAMFLLASISLLDDLITVPPWVRLLVQLLAVIIPLSIMKHPVFGEALPPVFDKAISALLWVWFINLFDAMDAIDGLSATEMICIALGFCLLTGFLGVFPNPLSVYSLVTMAAGVGFLWWNWHPAKIVLGRSGSIPIGFLIGYLLLLAISSGYLYAAAILPAYYLADGIVTSVRRLYHGKKTGMAHTDYYYLRAVRHGRKHSTVARYVFGVNLLLIGLATFTVIDSDLAWLHLAIAYMAVFMLLGFFAHTPHNPHHEPF